MPYIFLHGRRYPYPQSESFEKCSFLFEFKEGENFNRKNTLSILRIRI